MKLALFFALMFFSLFTSLLIGRFSLRGSSSLWKSFLYAVLTNIFIVGLASVWWFLTETDGLSQGLGVLYYCLALVVISIINFITLSILHSKQGS